MGAGAFRNLEMNALNIPLSCAPLRLLPPKVRNLISCNEMNPKFRYQDHDAPATNSREVDVKTPLNATPSTQHAVEAELLADGLRLASGGEN